MNWEDTVIKTHIENCHNTLEERLNEQAEVAFEAGIKEGLWKYAWWKDGTQYVGTTGTTLKEALKEVGGN